MSPPAHIYFFIREILVKSNLPCSPADCKRSPTLCRLFLRRSWTKGARFSAEPELPSIADSQRAPNSRIHSFHCRSIRSKLKEEIDAIRTDYPNFSAPSLVVVQVGNRSDSNVYIRNKLKFASEVREKKKRNYL